MKLIKQIDLGELEQLTKSSFPHFNGHNYKISSIKPITETKYWMSTVDGEDFQISFEAVKDLEGGDYYTTEVFAGIEVQADVVNERKPQ